MVRLPVIVRLKIAVTDADEESVTRAVKLDVPTAVGVPVIAPELEKDNPEGSVPETKDQK